LSAQTPGTLDKTFEAQMPADFVYQLFRPLTVQPDGKIIVGGACNWTEPGSQFLVRLTPDGALDSTFNPSGIRCFYGGDIGSIVVQADGKIVLGGGQWQVPEPNQAFLARLNADGSADSSFGPPHPDSPWYVPKLVVLPSGSILVPTCFCGGGDFSLLRLKPNGEVDSAFAPQVQVANGNVYDFAVQPDGRIVVSVPETFIDGAKRNVIRLMPDGSYDSSFQPVLTAGGARGLKVLPDGKILIGEPFERLHADGRLDLDFVPFSDDLDATSVAIQRDGKIIVAQFWRMNFLPTRQLVRLNTNGSRDETFVGELPLVGTSTNHFHVQALALQPDGKLVVSTVGASNDGRWIGSIIRLHGDGDPFIVPESIRRSADGGFEFEVTAATNRTVVLEATTDLSSQSWVPVASFPPAADRGPLTFTDPDAANFSRRFYRVATE
jgi:uncharacterized delta-60 repeat protein